jgi:hypothetical protein
MSGVLPFGVERRFDAFANWNEAARLVLRGYWRAREAQPVHRGPNKGQKSALRRAKQGVAFPIRRVDERRVAGFLGECADAHPVYGTCILTI